MSEDEDKIELKPDSKKLGKKSGAKSVKNNHKKSSVSFSKKKPFIPVLVVLAVLLLSVGAYLTYNFVSSNRGVEQELTRAEEQESFTLPDNVSNDKKNILAISNAWAYYDEQNYDRALEILETIYQPNEDVETSQARLYAKIYEAQGDTTKAQEYYAISLSYDEAILLEALETDPTTHFALAELYAGAGETDKARQHYEAYIVAVEAPRDEMGEYEYETMQKAKQALEGL